MTVDITPTNTNRTGAAIVQWLTIERMAYIAIGMLALVLRLVGLGQQVMAPGEAVQAMAALDLIRHTGAQPAGETSPLLLSLHALTFLVTHATEAASRVWPALAGTLLVLLTYGLRKELGRLGALFAALLLAVSSSLVFWSRSATGESFTLLAAMALIVGLAGWRRDPGGDNSRRIDRQELPPAAFAGGDTGSATVFFFGGTTPPRFRWVASRRGYASCMRHYGAGPCSGPDRM